MFNYLTFTPFPGLSSPHLQTIIGRFSATGMPPPSEILVTPLQDGDRLFSIMSTPENWDSHFPTVVLIHGLGGNHNSGYMVRFSRKIYQMGYRVLRVNLRGSGPGVNLSLKPYYGGNSCDIKEILGQLKQKHAKSPLFLIGFSLGGNIVLKLAGEIGDNQQLVDSFFAVCPPIDLAHTVDLLSQGFNKIYHRYYLHHLCQQAQKWLNGRFINSLEEYDNLVTAPQWGYENAQDYYRKCSSFQFIPRIHLPCNILYSGDDPFIDYRILEDKNIPSNVKIWVSSHGGHMGFMGRNEKGEGYHWMDSTLLKWLKGDFRQQ